MKKLFVVLSLFSVVSCFAAIPNASAYEFSYSQAYHKFKMEMEYKAKESDTGEISCDELRNILDKECACVYMERFLKQFKQKAPTSLKRICCTVATSVGVMSCALFPRERLSLQSVVKGGLIAACCVVIYSSIKVGFEEKIFDSFWKSRGYKRILDSSCSSTDYHFACAHWDKFLVTNYDNLDSTDQERVKSLLRSLQQLYPNEYPDVYSLKIDFEKIRAEKAIQALFGDVTHADGTERKRNNLFAATVDALLSR